MSKFVASGELPESMPENFYASSRQTIAHEAERLHGAAVEIANPISEEALMRFLQKGDTILDVGAGADATLGRDLTESGLHYVAVEPNASFVDILRKAGTDVYRGDVVDLPIESNSVDAVHMRFLFGWLNEEQKKSALRQAARVLKPGDQKVVTVIDYDWMMTDGPAEYMEMVGTVCDILESFGFNYQYGAEITSDVDELIRQNVFGPGIGYEMLPLETHEVARTIEDGFPLLEEAVSSLKESLSMIGDAETIGTLEQTLKNIQMLTPETNINLPGIATQTILLTKDRPSSERTETKLELLPGMYEVGDYAPTPIDGVVKVKRGSDLDEGVRKLQASEYLKNGMLTSEAVIINGMLSEDSYPKKHLDRSTLFVTMSEGEMVPTAAIRLIQTEPSDDPDTELRSLPTAERLGLSMSNHDIFPEELLASGVFEVSSSIRNSQEGGTFLDMSKVIIGLMAEARAREYHTALMSTQVRMYGILKKMFGEDNFKLIAGPHKSTIPGASDAMDFVSMSVDARYFFERLWEHTEKTKGSSRLSHDTNMLLENTFPYRQVA